MKFATSDDMIAFGTIVLIRVRPGTIGLATDNGKPVLLLPGLHFYDQPNPLQFQKCVPLTDTIIRNGPLNVVRVNPGLVGVATVNGSPVLLEAGVHFINEPVFEMDANAGLRRLDE